VGLSLFDDRIRTRIPAKCTRGHLVNLFRNLEAPGGGTVTAMGKPFHELADSIRKRGIVVVISDLLDSPEAILDGLKHFRFGGNDVIVFHIMDPAELTFDFKDMVEFEDLESGERMIVVSEDARETYLENLRQFTGRMKAGCGLMNVDYVLMDTSRPLDFALFQYLSKRSRRT
jgi:hypothetical protein